MSNPNTEIKRRNIMEIVKKHYEPGNQSKSLEQVWRHYVYPIYPMGVRTFRRHIKLTDVLNELNQI